MSDGEFYGVELPVLDIPKLVVERDQARRQVTELQEQLTQQVQQRRDDSIDYQVTEFHQKFGFPVRTVPRMPSHKEMRHRLLLITEEFFEVLVSIITRSVDDHVINYCHEQVRDWIRGELCLDNGKLPDLAKELDDLDRVVAGTRLVCGIPRIPVAKAVHESNMAKEPGHPKPVKPEGWKPPDIATILNRAGQ